MIWCGQDLFQLVAKILGYILEILIFHRFVPHVWLVPKNEKKLTSKIAYRNYINSSNTVRCNQKGWKTILWSKMWVLWHSTNHLKSAAIHSFKILCCKKFVDLSNEVLYILVSLGADKLPDVKVWGLKKKNLVRAHSDTDLLSKSVFECAHKRFFIKPQTLTSGSLSVPWDIRMYSTSF